MSQEGSAAARLMTAMMLLSVEIGATAWRRCSGTMIWPVILATSELNSDVGDFAAGDLQDDGLGQLLGDIH